MNLGQLVPTSLLCATLGVMTACMGTPGTAVTNATTAVYTRGAKQDTIAVKLPASTSEVFASMNRIIAEEPALVLEDRNDTSKMLEVTENGARMTAQATDLGDGRTLLFLWLDTRDTRLVASDWGLSAVKTICGELRVECEVVEQ